MQPSPQSILDHFHYPKRNPIPSSYHTPTCPLLSPGQLLSVSIDLPILDIGHKWNHLIRDLLWMASFWMYFEVELIVLAKGSCSGPLTLPGSGWGKITQPLPCARYYSEHFTCIDSFNPHTTFWGRHSHSPRCKLSDPKTTVALSHSFYVS